MHIAQTTELLLIDRTGLAFTFLAASALCMSALCMPQLRTEDLRQELAPLQSMYCQTYTQKCKSVAIGCRSPADSPECLNACFSAIPAFSPHVLL